MLRSRTTRFDGSVTSTRSVSNGRPSSRASTTNPLCATSAHTVSDDMNLPATMGQRNKRPGVTTRRCTHCMATGGSSGPRGADAVRQHQHHQQPHLERKLQQQSQTTDHHNEASSYPWNRRAAASPAAVSNRQRHQQSGQQPPSKQHLHIRRTGTSDQESEPEAAASRP